MADVLFYKDIDQSEIKEDQKEKQGVDSSLMIFQCI